MRTLLLYLALRGAKVWTVCKEVAVAVLMVAWGFCEARIVRSENEIEGCGSIERLREQSPGWRAMWVRPAGEQ